MSKPINESNAQTGPDGVNTKAATKRAAGFKRNRSGHHSPIKTLREIYAENTNCRLATDEELKRIG